MKNTHNTLKIHHPFPPLVTKENGPVDEYNPRRWPLMADSSNETNLLSKNLPNSNLPSPTKLNHPDQTTKSHPAASLRTVLQSLNLTRFTSSDETNSTHSLKLLPNKLSKMRFPRMKSHKSTTNPTSSPKLLGKKSFKIKLTGRQTFKMPKIFRRRHRILPEPTTNGPSSSRSPLNVKPVWKSFRRGFRRFLRALP
jgi:hypothetical protein